MRPGSRFPLAIPPGGAGDFPVDSQNRYRQSGHHRAGDDSHESKQADAAHVAAVGTGARRYSLCEGEWGVPPRRLERPTKSLGNFCSIQTELRGLTQWPRYKIRLPCESRRQGTIMGDGIFRGWAIPFHLMGPDGPRRLWRRSALPRRAARGWRRAPRRSNGSTRRARG